MSVSVWNWQQPQWPEFTYDSEMLGAYEHTFFTNAGVSVGALTHLPPSSKLDLSIEILAGEGVETADIEGERLDRPSVQSSIQRHFGFKVDQRNHTPAEDGMAHVLVDLYKTYSKSLTLKQLFEWHRHILSGRLDIVDIGRFRTDPEPMQVVSGPIHKPNIHFEAPPASSVKSEMKRFIHWFNTSAPGKSGALSPLIRAGIAHLYFVSIHPFEDGNGRLARLLAEKVLLQSVSIPTITPLSIQINAAKKSYYSFLESNNKQLEISSWLDYFSQIILDAQVLTHRLTNFVIFKNRLYADYQNALNSRQLHALEKIFRAGPQGFAEGLSAKKYSRMTQASASTATRDLRDFVAKGIFVLKGKLKSARYFLNFEDSS